MLSTKLFYSPSTGEMVSSDIEAQITSNAKTFKVDVSLIKAFIKVESMDQHLAMRYEPHLKRFKWYRNTIPKEMHANKYVYCSMGPMQVLYGIARSHGFKGQPYELLNPEYSIKYGVLHLSKLLKRYSLEDAISSYNQGSPKRGKDGKYKNQRYVDKIKKALANIKKGS